MKKYFKQGLVMCVFFMVINTLGYVNCGRRVGIRMAYRLMNI